LHPPEKRQQEQYARDAIDAFIIEYFRRVYSNGHKTLVKEDTNCILGAHVVGRTRMK
jgi:hypothetical protein